MKLIKNISYLLTVALLLSFFSSNYFAVPRCRGSLSLVSDSSTTLNTANTYYLLNGRFDDGYNQKFTMVDSGFVYSGEDALFLFCGTANVKSDKNCTITFGLMKNSETTSINDRYYTPITFNNANSYSSFALTKLVWLEKYDTLYIRGQSTASSTIVSYETLDVTFTLTM